MNRKEAPERDVIGKLTDHVGMMMGDLRARKIIDRQFDPTRDPADVQPSL